MCGNMADVQKERRTNDRMKIYMDRAAINKPKDIVQHTSKYTHIM